MTLISRIALYFFLMAGFSSTALHAAPVSGYEPVAGRQVIEDAFPQVTRYEPLEDNRAIQALYAGEELKLSLIHI